MQGYLPGQLYNLNSHYGNKEELKELLKAFKEAGVVTLADIVINHRCADAQDENGLWNTFRSATVPPANPVWAPSVDGLKILPRATQGANSSLGHICPA